MYITTCIYVYEFLCCSDAVAKAVCAINQAVESGDPAATLVALQAPAANLRSVTEECATAYTHSLSDARSEKAERGGVDAGGWMEHRTREGHAFYYNWKLENSQWERPEELAELSSHLRREEIQVTTVLIHNIYHECISRCLPLLGLLIYNSCVSLFFAVIFLYNYLTLVIYLCFTHSRSLHILQNPLIH